MTILTTKNCSPKWAFFKGHGLISFLLLVFLLISGASAQISQFFGGNNKLTYRGSLSYEGASAFSELSDICSFYANSGSIFGNPAAMMNINRMQIEGDVSLPGMGFNISTEKSRVLKSVIKTGLDGFFEGENEVDGENRVDPLIQTEMAQTPGFEGLGYTYRWGSLKYPVGVTAAFERLVDLELELELNDLGIGIGMPLDESDPASDSIKARFSAQTGLGLYLGLSRRGAGMAMELPKLNLKYGIAVHQYMGYFNFNALGEINGFISRSENESYFNLESSPYTDDLRIDYLGYGRGSAMGVAFGSSWSFLKYFTMDFAASWNGSMEMGYVKGEHFTLNAIDKDEPSDSSAPAPVVAADSIPEDDAGFFEVGKLNLTKLTLTKRVTNDIHNIKLQLPSRVGVSFSAGGADLMVHFDYAWYYRGLHLTYDHISQKVVFDTTFNDIVSAADGSDSVVTQQSRGGWGSDLKHKMAFGLYWWGLFTNMGVYVGDPIFYENSNKVGLKYMPIFNFGYSIELSKQYFLDVSVISFPMTIFKTNFRYRI